MTLTPPATTNHSHFMAGHLGITSAALAWHHRAACVDVDKNLFFPTSGANQSAAIAVCYRCPVRTDCLAWALQHEDHGIWGGMSERERRRIRRYRQGRTWADLADVALTGHLTLVEDRP